MNKKIDMDNKLPEYLPYPKFLLKSDLPLAAREVYALLLHRTTISQINNWTDDEGNVFVIYPILELAKELNCSDMTIKRALKTLTEADLIERRRTTFNGANRLFLKFPEEQKCSCHENENVLSNSTLLILHTEQNCSPKRNNLVNIRKKHK